MVDNQQSNTPLSASGGMHLDGTPRPSEVSYALNATTEGHDGNAYYYQMEGSNTLFSTLPADSKSIGAVYIPQRDVILQLLAYPDSGDSEIGLVDVNSGAYTQLLTDKDNDQKLRFDVKFPVRKIHLKQTNCALQAYWTDGKLGNGMRYLDLDNLPWQESRNPDNDYKPILNVGKLDVNKMRVTPLYKVPVITPVREATGGRLRMGSYQFSIQYGNSLGEGYTQYYSTTYPMGVFEQRTGSQPDDRTSKSITLEVTNLDTSGLWDYFNLAVIKTINGTSSVYRVGTFPVTGNTFRYTYTGADETEVRLDATEIIEQFPHYDTARLSFEVDGIIGWQGLTYDMELNLQDIALRIPVKWETVRLPYTEEGGYHNGTNTSLYRGYQRDEVYALEIFFLLDNGQQTRAFHIPGRKATLHDLEWVDNADSNSVRTKTCDTPVQKRRWQVYNTGSLTGYSPEFLAAGQDDCYIGPCQYGEMAYWESTRIYPNNPDIYGELSGQPIRHHKFPDNLITHIHDQASGDVRSHRHFIYPIGFRIPEGAVEQAIADSDISPEHKARIVGWGIVRGDRAGGNKSIIAKGIFSNVGQYEHHIDGTEDGETELCFYPNWPFNDLRKDPYFSTKKLHAHSGYVPAQSLDGFGDHSRSRFTFHSPDTHFYRSTGISEGYLKLETVEYGKSFGHFVPVRDNARYRFLSPDAYRASTGIAAVSGLNLGAGTFGSPTVSFAPVPAAFLSAKEMFENLIPYTNFGYSFNSTGYYSNYFAIPNNGDKIREISFGRYVGDGKEHVEEGKLLNNFRRESSVYLHTASNFLFPHEYDSSIPEDTSRYTLSSDAEGLYGIDEYLLALINSSGNILSDDDINTEMAAYNLTPGSNQATVILETTLPTTDIPEVGDIYMKGVWSNGIAYVVSAVSFIPSSPTSSTVTLTCTISGWTPSYVPLSGAGKLINVFKAGGSSSSSASSVSYTLVSYTPPVSNSVYTLAGVRAALSAFLAGYPGRDDYYALLDGDDTNKILYLAIDRAYRTILRDNTPIKDPGIIRSRDICSYYGAIKVDFPDQWGALYGYEVSDTGYRQVLNQPTRPIFGGDTYINRFALKSKVQLFLDTTFGAADGADIEYDYKGTYGWPMYWISTKPEDLKVNIRREVERVISILENSPFVGGDGSDMAKLWTAIKGIFTGGFANAVPVLALLLKIFRETVRTVGVNNLNLDNYREDGLREDGLFYQYAYGVSNFFVESEVNVDYRQATNETDGNFYPNAGGGIPDDWLQEANTPIIHDNSYNYNTSYSKQHHETFIAHLRDDFDKDKPCQYKEFSNRAIWSEKSSEEETKNHWLIYRPSNRFDFPKSYGSIVGLDSTENRQVIVRFRDRIQLHNALTTVETSAGPSAYLASAKLFSVQPVDIDSFGGSDQGQMLNTPYGRVCLDTIRGRVLLINRQQQIDIAAARLDGQTPSGCGQWFKNYLPFFSKRTINGTELDTDNALLSAGYSLVYDSRYKRLILSKKDFEPLVSGIRFDKETGEYLLGDAVISLTDSNYFRDRSFSISFSFLTGSWASFHSYVPDYYLQLPDTFLCGLNSDATLWQHGKTFTGYHNFFGSLSPYILEYPIQYPTDKILQSVRDFTQVRKYSTFETFTTVKGSEGYFNKVWIYNDEQCSGPMNLIPKGAGGNHYGQMPRVNADSTDIQVTRTDSFWSFNQFFDRVKDSGVNIFNPSEDLRTGNKEINLSNLDFSKKAYSKSPFRGTRFYVRLIKDDESTNRLVTRILLPEATQSV